MILYSITTFISSVLLFTVQLIVGKRVLPWFGGVASVWTTSMLFFMLFLFLGYLYVNFLSTLNRKLQVKIHLSLSGITFISVITNYVFYRTLIIPYPHWLSSLSLDPSFKILILIFLSIGLPYLLLSTTSTLLQYWFNQKSPDKSPFFLYVISNIGSFLGLISYPLLLESRFTLSNQENYWVIAFLFYILLTIIITRNISLLSRKIKAVTTLQVENTKIIFWVTVSAISNIALLATTSNITQSISPVPFLWILPLSLFLISYIIAFSGDSWYSRPFHTSITLFAIISTVLINSNTIFISYWANLFVTLFTLFMINLICHTELYRSRPNPRSLVIFYTSISLGGVLAGIFCALIAPWLFSDLWEFPLSFVFITILYIFLTIKSTTKFPLGLQKVILASTVIYLTIYFFRGMIIPTSSLSNTTQLYRDRNFYGMLTITDTISQDNSTIRYLTNGKITHGHQNLSLNTQEPTSYYTKESGVGLSIMNHPKKLANKPMRIGVIGLGVGTMAAYCNSGDLIKFYEINPRVIDISNKYFTFVSGCYQRGGAVEVSVGDARLSLANELSNNNSQQFDVLVIDAFTDDAIPIHLITKEATDLFVSHLADGGVVAFHISNHYLSLDKVLDKIADTSKLYTYIYNTSSSVWYMISPLPLKKPFDFNTPPTQSNISLWTDDYSNILEIFR